MPALKRLLPHRPSAARGATIETTVERQIALALWRRGWRPQVIAYTGYGATGADGADGWVRVLARVLLLPAGDSETKREAQRGWRQFLTLALDDVQLRVKVGQQEHVVRSAAGGYVDVGLPWAGEAGWHDIDLVGLRSRPTTARARVVGADEREGIISDIDDTVMVTAIPRPLLAFWNSFVRVDTSRKPVPGMPEFFQRVLRDKPDVFVAYLSTGAWNVAPSIQRFLRKNGYPEGPLLMTDWGPSTSAGSAPGARTSTPPSDGSPKSCRT
jgi:phosphatidate phosphatase APP1